MAHEAGHAFGLPHPDAAGTWFGADLNSHSIMGSHWNFPERYARAWTPPSPWGFLNYERDVLRYNPLVSVTGSPYQALSGDPMERPALPNPSLSLTAAPVDPATSRLSWTNDGANRYYLYWSAVPDLSTHQQVVGSPTTATSLNHADSGQQALYFKVLEIALHQ